MREKAVIPLAQPLRSPEGLVKQIVLREPTFDEYLAFGDPYSIAFTEAKTPFAVENPGSHQALHQRLPGRAKDPAILHQAGAMIARDVKSKLLDFSSPRRPRTRSKGRRR